MTGKPLPDVFLLPGRDRRIRGGHPWAYSNEVRMDEDAKALPPGTLVALRRVDGKPLGVGTFNPHALIAFRLFSRDVRTAVDGALVAGRLERALDLRRRLFAEPFYRLVHAEADGLPGLIADRFGDLLVVQGGTAGIEALMPEVLEACDDVLAPTVVVLRNDGPFRRMEDLEAYVRIAKGRIEDPVEVREGGLSFLADVTGGQKTGWFYDQRENRAFVAGLARGGRMLDLYCYGGAFAVSAAAAGARAVSAVDSSAAALALGRRAAERNGVAERCAFARADAFEELDRLHETGERFDVVAADPPAFVRARKGLKSGVKGYRKLARMAAGLVAPGGFLFIASCSHNVEAGLFAGEVALGVAKAGRGARIIRAAGAGADHPVHPFLAETAYLKTLVLRLD